MQHLNQDISRLQELKVIKHKCETDFMFFVRYFFKKRFGYNFSTNSHHYRIAKKLTDVYEGRTTRLIINMPPRYGKTEMAVICFVAWCIARNPSSKFIHLSYSDDLVLDNSSQIKELLESDEYQELWAISLKKDSHSKKKWYTEQGGGLYATSAGGAVTGFGAGSTRDDVEFQGAVIIDDPLKADDGESDNERGKVNMRINRTIKSRVNSRKTPIIVIMQRLHDMDLTGFLLNGGTGEEWEHLCIPAIENGQALWSWKHTIEELRTMEKADRYTFSGQYLQQPVLDDGIMFQREWFKFYKDLPEGEDFGASDFAATLDGGDFTEHGVFRVTPDGRIFVKEWWSGQTDSDVWIESLLDLAAQDDIKLWGGETGPIKSSIEPFLRRRMLEKKQFIRMEWFSHATKDKWQNARGFQALASSGRVYLPVNKEWSTDLLNQLVRFPKGRYDDKVDVCSIFAKMINQLWAKEAIKVEPKADPNSINEIINAHKRKKQAGYARI